MANDFIWKGKWVKIPLDILQLEKSEGLGLADLKNRDLALKLQWVTRLKTDKLLYLKARLGSGGSG